MTKDYDSSLHENNSIARAQIAVNKLHNAVSQALSHPTEQMLEQAENRLAHTEEAVMEAAESAEGGQGVDLVNEALDEEKIRLRGAEDVVYGD
ncbi:hypothetical protein [Paenibacillus physcomitrellae]|uniref:Uncharacterized protein n=1 Tax=Paenibacillus physcomitrellae TaxID=1619311 RepID=A0ABQ1FS18_9BACL|nr:hypothetical protein [Paenibacillus physcomitrellae]GGA25420.1 hypothetical protein GCM10010917_07930 [Paenibacillus physcomitrellae]